MIKRFLLESYIYIYTSLRNRPILVYGVRYWITLLSSGNCKNQVMGYLGHLCRAGKVRGRVRVPVLSLSLSRLWKPP